jgi:hypothetical protein
MFRRRIHARRLRRALRPAGGPALLRLQEANRLLAEGQPAAAASIFVELADQAAARGIPRSPQLHLQAGRAWILAGDPGAGVERLALGLRTMAGLGQIRRLPRVTRQVLSELRGRGMEAEADELQRMVLGMAPGAALEAEEPSPPSKRRLPTKCPHCGGTVIPDAVEWLDESSAMCDYCGSVLSAEG